MPAAAEARRERRRAAVPPIAYPPQLPGQRAQGRVCRRDPRPPGRRRRGGDRLRARRPSCRRSASSSAAACAGTIAHTQPRRLAARTVAERIAQRARRRRSARPSGYAVRFSDRSRADTLRPADDRRPAARARSSSDRLLRRYDTVIVDEAHERSLNIDFLLGYLARILPRRPDLKLIITSATIDPQRFARALRRRAGRRGLRPHLPGRGALPARRGPRSDATRPTRSATPSRSCCASRPATCSSSSPASARSATPPRRSRAGCGPTSRSSRSTRGSRRASSSASSSRAARAASCWRRTSPRRR